MARGWTIGWGGMVVLTAACQEPSTSGTSREGATSAASTGEASSSSGADETGTPPVLPDLGDPPPRQTASCLDYVTCAQDLMLDDADAIEQMYGSGAACWDTSESMAQCDGECEAALAALVMQLEADGEEVPVTCDPPEIVPWSRINGIIEDHCVTGCHEPGGTDESLDLSDQPYYALYQVSSDQSLLYLVDPSAHQDSYFWHKVNGSHGSVGGMGGRMPRGADPLPQEDIDAIADWIDNGALLL